MMSLEVVKLVSLTRVSISMLLLQLELVGLIYRPMRYCTDVSNRSVSLTYQLRGHYDVSAWSTKSRLVQDLKETSHAWLEIVGIPMASDRAPFFVHLFLAFKEAVWVKAQSKLGTINVQKINNSFHFIDEL